MRTPFNREVSVKAHLRVRSLWFVVALCAAIGVSFVQAQNEQAPLWPYGFATPPKPGDKAAPQAPPTRNLRPNEDPAEQTRAQHVEGSSGSYTLVDIRDGLLQAFAHVIRLVAVAKLPGLVHARASPARHGGRADRVVVERHIDFDRRISAAIEDLSSVNVNDHAHGKTT